MLKIAVYGKGGTGKSTISFNLPVTLSERGYKVMQVGCDPEANSTIQLHQGHTVTSILDIIRVRGDKAGPDGLVTEGSGGMLCVEAGGPTPGMGCAGRGIIAAFKALKEGNAFEVYKPGMVIYNTLGDVVYGGFTMPIQGGYADKVLIVTFRENVAIYAAANIVAAVRSFETRGYASLGGILLNRRGVKREQEKVEELTEGVETEIIGSLDYSSLVGKAEELGKTVMETYLDSDMVGQYRKMADTVLVTRGEEEVKKTHA